MTPEEAYDVSIANPSEFKKNKDYYESILAMSGPYSYNYARDILSRFEKGEKTIATHDYYSYLYAKYILNDRFELGEYAFCIDLPCFERYIPVIKNKTSFYYKFI